MYSPASCLIALAGGDWHADCSFSIFPKMGRKASLSDIQRARIVTLHEDGHSERKIAVKMSCSKTAVHILSSIILMFMAIIPIRKRVVGREKLRVEMTTW